MFDAGFHTVSETLVWSASVSLPRVYHYDTGAVFRQPMVFHPDHVANPTELSFQDQSLNASYLSSVHDLARFVIRSSQSMFMIDCRLTRTTSHIHRVG